MGLLSLPAMIRAGYDRNSPLARFARQARWDRSSAVDGADLRRRHPAGANQQAQLELGNLSPDPISVGQLFAGAMLPGLVLVGLYLLWILANRSSIRSRARRWR